MQSVVRGKVGWRVISADLGLAAMAGKVHIHTSIGETGHIIAFEWSWGNFYTDSIERLWM